MSGYLILVVEDEESIVEPVVGELRRDGFDVVAALTCAQARAALVARTPDLVLLDLMLPDGDGRELLREIRVSSRVPVIVLTARGDEIDRVVGLELGADDYVTKPFSMAELLARVRAVLRRVEPAPASVEGGVLVVGDLRLDRATRGVTLAGQLLHLTLKEFELLAVLMRERGRAVTRTELMDEVWDVNWFGSTKTLDVHVASLRRKLGDDPASPRYVHTVRGVGFRVADEPSAEER